MSGSQAAVYTNPFRTLGIRLDRLGQAGLPAPWSGAQAKRRPLGGEWPPVWRLMTFVVRASKVTSVTCPQWSLVPQWWHWSLGVVSRWGLRHLPPPVPSVPPHPFLPCLVTWLTIHLGEKTLPEHAWCTTLLSVLAMRQGAGPWPARAPLHQQRGQTTGRPNN